MGIIKHIVFLTKKYPNSVDGNALSFVQQLVWTMADLGVKATVICPAPVTTNIKYNTLPFHTEEKTENGNIVEVYYPKCIGLGDSHLLFGKSPIRITTYYFQKAVEKVIHIIGIPDAFYGHFIAPPGIVAAKLGKKYDKPSFFAYGEAYPVAINWYGKERVEQIFRSLSGVIAVSTKNKEEIIETGVVNDEQVAVFPNGYREERFYPRDKRGSREKFGFPQDKTIISFVGSFDDRKGILRLDEAVDKTNDCYVAYAGKGKLLPKSSKCLWAKTVENSELPYFLSASDFFVLPTLSEGCCNAIIEAMACGLPIISSDRGFNDDILDDSCSIRIDPESIEEIKDAIELLKKSNIRNKLSQGSLRKAESLTLNKRAVRIYEYICDKAESSKSI